MIMIVIYVRKLQVISVIFVIWCRIALAGRLQKSIENSIILNQYKNPYNKLAHYDTTAEEILASFTSPEELHDISMVVMGAGTGGTMTGIAMKLKEKISNIKIVGVDPYGSILSTQKSNEQATASEAPYDTENNGDDRAYDSPVFEPKKYEKTGGYLVEGIGYDFIPESMDPSLADHWYRSTDEESFLMSRNLIRYEGLLVGGSSGSAMSAAITIAKRLNIKGKVIVILPDSIRNYLTKFVADDWMYCHDFLKDPYIQEIRRKQDFSCLTLASLKLGQPCSFQQASVTVRMALKQLKLVNASFGLIKEKTELKGIFEVKPISYKLLLKDTSEKKRFLETPAFQVMTSITEGLSRNKIIHDSMLLQEAEKLLFNSNGMDTLLVLDGENRVKGVLSIHDIVYLQL